MATHHAILGLLGLGERCGYEIRRELEAVDPTWRLEFGQLYRLLAALERRGQVTSRRVPGRKGPQRKLYELTEAGRGELEGWLETPEAEVRCGRDEFHLKLQLCRSLGGAKLAELIGKRREGLEAQRAEALIERTRASSSGDRDRWLLAETRLRQLEGALTALISYLALEPSARRGAEEAAPPGLRSIVAAGSDDPILELLARRLARDHPGASLSTRPTGSLAGLLSLREGRAHLAGTHLLDVETGEYNAPFIRRLLFEEPILLVNLAFREQGLMVAPGNPRGLGGVRDLRTPSLRLINRQRGAGTRLLLHAQLLAEQIDPRSIEGFDSEAPTHEAVASAIALGEVDVGMGLREVAQRWELGFLPIGSERYDLAIPRSVYDSPLLEPLREVLTRESFRAEAAERVGYDVSQMGEVMAEVR